MPMQCAIARDGICVLAEATLYFRVFGIVYALVAIWGFSLMIC